MNFNLIIHPPAVADIEAARAYLAGWSEQAADRWYEAVKTQIAGLVQMPRRFPVAPESRHVGREVRQLLVGKYRVLFTVSDQDVHVLHVRHASLPPMSPEEGF
jgi:plasmid stabilization system protein ParE